MTEPLKDKIITYYRRKRGLLPRDEAQLAYAYEMAPKRAKEYVEFFKKNVCSDLRDKRILDFGSGSGIYALEFLRAGAKIIGVDNDNGLLKIAKDYAKGVCFISNNSNIPFQDGCFDYCYCVATFEHLDDPSYWLGELCRVLKKGGVLHISFPNRFHIYDNHTQLYFVPWFPYRIADMITRFFRHHDLKYYSNLRFYSYRVFRRMLDRTVFAVIKGKSSSLIKRMVIELLHQFNISHTALTQNISLFLRKETE